MSVFTLFFQFKVNITVVLYCATERTQENHVLTCMGLPAQPPDCHPCCRSATHMNGNTSGGHSSLASLPVAATSHGSRAPLLLCSCRFGRGGMEGGLEGATWLMSSQLARLRPKVGWALLGRLSPRWSIGLGRSLLLRFGLGLKPKP